MSNLPDDRERAQLRAPSLTQRQLMDITKTAVKELIQEQAAIFGWWTLRTLGVAIIGALVIFLLWTSGWHK